MPDPQTTITETELEDRVAAVIAHPGYAHRGVWEKIREARRQFGFGEQYSVYAASAGSGASRMPATGRSRPFISSLLRRQPMPEPMTVERGRWYPDVPPALPGETDETYTDRLTGADRTNRVPYDHPRNPQCSIGYHGECTDPAGEVCKCPHHTDTIPDGVTLTAALSAAAGTLANCYYLPTETGVRVMVIATGAGRGATPEDLRTAIGEAYGSKISDGFVTDVVNILKAQGLRDD
jgi:hypothetical protein